MKQPIPFGKYYLLERINVGGMAEVFKAKATGVEGFERLVAVKRILPNIAEDEEFITMFVDEAKIAVQLTHANIAQIFDLGRVEGSYFIALEYVHGKDLRAMFNRSRQRGEILPIPLSCYAIMKLCEGLDYAHNKHDSTGAFLNLVHRDVSPQNILISYEGEVKIVDFGIAKAAGKVGRTQAGILKGKFGYMSPEQVLGLEIDRRSDVFGVGICLYELLTGERLFIADTDFATLEKVRSVDIMPASTYNRRIPEELEQIVMRALARDRELRYQTAMQLHDELQAFMHTSGNLFTRKDLSAYMHRVFAEEIDKETARDHEYAALDPARGSGEENDLAAFDAIEPVSTVSALSAQPGYGGGGAAAAPKPEVRTRKATLLGIPHASGLRAPTVPRLVPSPASVPPSNPSSRPSAPSRPPVALAASHTQGMEWDDEELSTQIYDRPDNDTGPNSDSDDSDDGLDNLQASVPEGVSAQLVVRPNSQPGLQGVPVYTNGGNGVRLPTRTLSDTPQPYTSLQPPDARAARERADDTARERSERSAWASASEPNKSRPMLAAIVAVVAIVTCIVLGLLLFGQREPGTVNLTTNPRRVAVSVDGRSLGVSNSPFVIGELSAGQRHEIVVSSPGYRPWTKTIELQSGQVLTIPDAQLERIDTGFSLGSDPAGALVFVDGKSLGRTTPLKVIDLTAGDHRIRIEHPGYAPWESSLHATTGTVLPLPTVTLQPMAAEPAAPSGSASGRSWSWRKSSSSSSSGTARSEPEPANEPADTRAAADQPGAPSEPVPAAPEKDVIEPSPYRTEPAAPPPSAAAEPEPAPAEKAPETTSKPEPAGTGKLRVNTRPWSQVFIDGQAYGATPRMNIELPAGPHTLKLVNEEFKIAKTMEIDVVPGEAQSIVLDLLE